MPTTGTTRWDRETFFVLQLAACISFLSFLYYLRQGDVLLYGDAVAHINIARRVFDSRTPGLLQLGTVWLPLPHLLMIPFLLIHSMWQTGIGGSIPSMIAYIFGAVGIFRLVRCGLSFHSQPDSAANGAAWIAAGIYAANPNLVYLQSTAMTEPLYLALFIWTMVHFSEFVQAGTLADERTQLAASSSLVKCGACLAAACLTRYDGWFLTAAICVAAVPIIVKSRRNSAMLLPGFKTFIVLAVLAPALWIAYNAAVYRNPVEFANGPYSAKAIEQKNPTGTTYPGSHNLPVAFSFFFKSAELNVAEGVWQKFWVALLIAGVALAVIFDRRRWPFLLLLTPVPFYMLSIAYSGVPIYVPSWWPFSYYNVRYGIELLPAFSVFVSLTIYFLLGFARNRASKAAVVFGTLIFVAGSYVAVWRAKPASYQEALMNSRTRIALETELASTFKKLPSNSTLLMYLGNHVGALQQAGIPLRQVINEGNHRPWEKPADPQGLWERALSNPRQYADYVVAAEGDPVATGVRKDELTPMVIINVSGQPPVTISWTHRQSAQ
ncbi:MAG TPA: hypothetical protein VFA74_08915 [Terriglobales bacterium]|nr:hypothetical protein [Terriglobales bacterium]